MGHDRLIGIVLQARMGSTRLPGKMLLEMAGHSLIWHSLERLRRVRKADSLVVAVPEGVADSPLVDHCVIQGVKVFRGSEEDVLDRYYRCACQHGFEHVVRATGDCPLVDPQVVDAMIDLHLAEGADYTSSKDEVGCGVPNGTGLEMFRFSALERSYKECCGGRCREHINEYILGNPNSFHIAAYGEPPDKHCPELDLTVDTEEDFCFVKRLVEDFGGDHDRLTIPALIARWSWEQARR